MDTADGSSPTITLQTGDTDIAQDDVLGSINFQAEVPTTLIHHRLYYEFRFGINLKLLNISY